MKKATKPRWVRYLRATAATILLLLAVAFLGIAVFLRGSLPTLEGEISVAGLESPAEIERDLHGVVTIRAETRNDVAFATGFVHGQERLFQMDLARRQAAGELAELLGGVALRQDRAIRSHQLRGVARSALARADTAERILVERYAAGVRAGVEALRTLPFEYGLLGVDPAPWQPEDSYLVMLSMFLELDDEAGSWELAHGLLNDSLSPALYRFLTPHSTSWDAPLLAAEPAIEGPPRPPSLLPASIVDLRSAAGTDPTTAELAGPEPIPGSNLWAVAGHRARDGQAIVANDMHLGLSLPNIWFRASFVWPRSGDPSSSHQVTGATLPGIPVMVIGSNRRVAWGLANSRIDTADVVFFNDGQDTVEVRTEVLKVRGRAEEELVVRTSSWGPVLGRDDQGRNHAVRWVAHHPEAVDLRFRAMETVADVDEALDIGRRSGMPALSLVVGDTEGRIGWTYTGQLPRRVGFTGRLPGPWSAEKRWDGWLEPSEVPRRVDPESGILWAANNRLVEGPWSERVGDGGYAFGARARQIRDRLLAVEQAEVEDMLAIQLDDRALYLEPWRDLLLESLDDSRAANDLRAPLEAWDGRALPSDPGYRAAYIFRKELLTKTLEPFLGLIEATGDDFPARGFERQWQDTALRILQQRPSHLLNPNYESWDALLTRALGAASRAAQPEALARDRGWRPVQIRHPLSRALPGAGRWLDIQPQRLPGGPEVPRLQMPRFGASQRMAVTPGKEDEGYFQMPGGQSGHPLSPHYRNLQEAWSDGEPAPFLPGSPVAELRLRPAPRSGAAVSP